MTNEPDFRNQPLTESMRQIFRDAHSYIKGLPKWERGVHIFWLLGPFILLIERSPADLWLSLVAIIFVVRTIIKKQTAWLKYFWVRAGLAFWVITLLSALLSSSPAYSLGEAHLFGLGFLYLQWQLSFGSVLIGEWYMR